MSCLTVDDGLIVMPTATVGETHLTEHELRSLNRRPPVPSTDCIVVVEVDAARLAPEYWFGTFGLCELILRTTAPNVIGCERFSQTYILTLKDVRIAGAFAAAQDAYTTLKAKVPHVSSTVGVAPGDGGQSLLLPFLRAVKAGRMAQYFGAGMHLTSDQASGPVRLLPISVVFRSGEDLSLVR